MTRLGNDVVDLRDPRCRDKISDDRFLSRVFSEEEAEAIRSSSAPEAALWVRWAAKEASFKVVTKLLGSPPTFEHAAFRVRMGEFAGEAGPPRTGRVRYRGTEIPFRAERAPDRIHVLAWHASGDASPAPIHHAIRHFAEMSHYSRPEWRENLRRRFTDREWAAVYSAGSALVRLRARAHLARTLAVEESMLEIVCDEGPPGKVPPRVLVDGRSADTDLSLSHHGRFLAWAFTAPEGTPEAESE